MCQKWFYFSVLIGIIMTPLHGKEKITPQKSVSIHEIAPCVPTKIRVVTEKTHTFQPENSNSESIIFFDSFEALTKAHRDVVYKDMLEHIVASETTLPDLPPITIAIDGGAGSGKSSTSKLLAERHSLLYVSTGYIYRALTLYFLQRQIPSSALERVQLELSHIQLSTQISQNEAMVMINGVAFSIPELKSEEVNQNVMEYSNIPFLRKFLVNYQRALPRVATELGYKGIVMEGRDITSAILPNAPYRFLLQADLEIRAQRRAQENVGTDNIQARDQKDAANMPIVDGVIILDTGRLNLEQVVAKIESIVPFEN